MRTKYAMINAFAGVGSHLVITAMSFVSRTIFIYTLGAEYLGINGLFTSLLMMLSIAEAGIGTAITYSLHKPVADEDHAKILTLMRLYRNIYRVIAGVILALGLCMLPFLSFFVQGTSVEQIHLIYVLFLLNTALPYLFQHKSSFIKVCQKGYIVTSVYTISAIISTSMKIGVLYYTQNYILFLVLELVINVLTATILAGIVNRMYPKLKQPSYDSLESDTKKGIIRNVKAIVLQRVGNYFVFGVDNLMISYFIGIVAVGLYSNYVMLIEICRNLVNQIFSNLYDSVGNLVATEHRDKVYQVFKITMLVNFWLYSFFSIAMLLLIEPFIKLWIGSDYVMTPAVLALLVVMFYERGMRNSITTIKTTSGIFHEDRYAPLSQAGINLGASLLLVQFMGLEGIFLGTLLSALAVPLWLTPYLVYKKVFHLPVRYYAWSYVRYVLVGAGAYATMYGVSSFLPEATWGGLVLKGVVCCIGINVLYIIIFHRTSEFQYLADVLRTLGTKVHSRGKMMRKMEG